MPKTVQITLETTHEACVAFHVEKDGSLVLDEFYGIDAEPEEAIALLFSPWMLKPPNNA